MDNLKAFTNDTDTYIAKSVDDALAAFKETVGGDYVLDGYGEKDDWWECDPEDYETIHFEDGRMVFPREFEVLERKEYFVMAKARLKDWIVFNGRGFLSSTEF